MEHRIKLVSVYLMLLLFVFFAGCSGQRTEQDSPGYAADVLKTEAVTYSGILGQGASLPINYNLEALDVELKAPSYELPLQRDKISNYGTFSTRIPLDASALEILEKNGFVVIENPYNPAEEDITSMYVTLKEEEVPIFITTDSLLHLYHIQFDETLRQIEEKEFYDAIWETDLALLDASVEKYNSASGEEKEAVRRNTAYFAVALSLLQPKPEQVQAAEDPYGFTDEALFPAGSADQYQFEIPSFVKEEVETELALIEKHEGFSVSPIFLYKEDYSQYVPRGHYTHSELLKNYFKAFMWHGRMSMLLKGELIKSEDPAKDDPHPDYPGKPDRFRARKLA